MALTVVQAASEVLTIGAVIPFLALLAGIAPGRDADRFQKVFEFFRATTPTSEMVAATALFCAAAVGSAGLRLLIIRKSQNFASEFGHELSVEVQRRMLWQSYSWHVRHNSSQQIAAIEKAEVVTSSVLLPLMQAAAATILVVLVSILLLSIAPLVTVAAGVGLGLAYYALAGSARRRLTVYSREIGAAYETRVRAVQEALSGIRDIILEGSQPRMIEDFRAADLRLAHARAEIGFVSAIPRILIEAVGMIVLAGVALYMADREGGLVRALPILGAIAVGTQRLLPIAQQLYTAWSDLLANREIIDHVALQLQLPLPDDVAPVRRMPFKQLIEFRDVAFTYADRNDPALDGLSFKIPKGSRVALVGPTGSGKSTTADLLMGLLDPTSGELLIDGTRLTATNLQRWRANIAHVPQMLFVADASLAENIALANEIDMKRVRDAARLAHLEDFISSLPEAYETRVGERGLLLSGGQRQRLAIARAIYKNAEVLVLDEATSALDDATESAVLGALDHLQQQGRTIIIIAHRQSTTIGCDLVLNLDGGRLVRNSVQK